MSRRIRTWRWIARARVWGLPLALLLCVTLPHLGQGDFRGDAGWYSAIGLQAWRTGGLWVLYGEPGQPYFNKPPLAFWIHGLVLHALGPQLWASRLPSIGAAAACVLLTVAVARELAGRRAALFSGIALALTVEFFRRTREVSLDMWQAAFLLGALYCIVLGVRQRPGGWFTGAGLCVGLALMTKPLTGLLFFPVVGAWLMWVGQWRRAGWLFGSLLAAVVIAAPWHLSMVQLHGREFLAQYFGTEILERAAGRLQAGHAEPPEWWFYFRKLATLYWPWLPAAVLGGWLVLSRPAGSGRRTLGTLSIAWVALWLLFLTVYPDRRDRYAIVLYPGLAWLAGLWLAQVRWSAWRWAERGILRGLGPAMAATAVVVSILPVRLQAPPQRHWLELFQWMRSECQPRLWQGAIAGAQGARLYLEFGFWPATTRDRRGQIIARPPRGAYLLYHDRAGWAPGPGEQVVFRTHNGDLAVTRLDSPAWEPAPIPDPGE